MVSNTLNIDLKDLLAILERLRREHGRTKEYREIRQELPADWPI